MPHRTAFRTLTSFFGNFRVLILLITIGVLLATAAGFMFFTRQEVTRAMLNAGDESARNVLQVVKLSIENQYKDIRFFKEYAQNRYREQLKNLVGVVVSQIDFYHAMYERGMLSEEEAKQEALESVEKLRYGKGDYFFIYDSSNIAISHPDINILGKDMTHIKDLNGLPVLDTLREESCETGEGAFTTIMSPRRPGEKILAPKLICYLYYPKWEWMVGTGVYIDDIDSDIEKKTTDIMNVLKETFSNVKIFDSGYFFLVGADKKVLIHPYLKEGKAEERKDASSGKSYFDCLKEDSINPTLAWKHLWKRPDLPSQSGSLEYSHVEHFKPFDWYIGSSVSQNEMEKPARAIIRRQMIALGVTVLIFALIIYFLVSRVVGPLARLSRHTDTLRRADFSLSEEEAAEALTVTFPGEVRRLAQTIWNMEQRLKEYLENLKETTAAKERIESELRIARDIQLSMVPQDLCAFEGRNEIDLAARLKPAREVGGDLYDFFFIDSDRLCLLMGDVSDKGVPASLFMVRSKTLLRNAMLGGSNEPNRVLETVSRELCQGNDRCMFLTVFLAILNVKTGELTYSNAGHMPPLLLKARGGHETVELPQGLPLGLSKKAKYSCMQLQMEPGDGLLLFTDGITEATDPEGNLFDYVLLEEVVKKMHRPLRDPTEAEVVVETVLREVEEFSKGSPQADDIAILCLRRPWAGMRPVELDFSVPCDSAKISAALEELDRFSNRHETAQSATSDLRVAMEEVLGKIAEQAPASEAKGIIRVKMRIEEKAFIVSITDPGRPFSLLEVQDTSPGQQAEAGKAKDMGLQLVRNIMDGLNYEHREGRNILKMVKRLN